MNRAVLDVNVLVSAMLSSKGAPRRLLEEWRDGTFLLITSDGIIAEVVEKLRNPRIGGRYGVDDEDVWWVSALLASEAVQVSVTPDDIEIITGDPEDDYVLVTARLAAAEMLVTGDKRLLALYSYANTRIISPSEFLNQITS